MENWKYSLARKTGTDGFVTKASIHSFYLGTYYKHLVITQGNKRNDYFFNLKFNSDVYFLTKRSKF